MPRLLVLDGPRQVPQASNSTATRPHSRSAQSWAASVLTRGEEQQLEAAASLLAIMSCKQTISAALRQLLCVEESPHAMVESCFDSPSRIAALTVLRVCVPLSPVSVCLSAELLCRLVVLRVVMTAGPKPSDKAFTGRYGVTKL